MTVSPSHHTRRAGRPGGLVVTLEYYYKIGLVLGFESHVGRAVDYISKKEKKKKNQLLRAPCSVGRRDSIRVDEGRRG